MTQEDCEYFKYMPLWQCPHDVFQGNCIKFLTEATVSSDVNYTEYYKYVYPDCISLIQTFIYDLCSCRLKHKSTTGILIGNTDIYYEQIDTGMD